MSLASRLSTNPSKMSNSDSLAPVPIAYAASAPSTRVISASVSTAMEGSVTNKIQANQVQQLQQQRTEGGSVSAHVELSIPKVHTRKTPKHGLVVFYEIRCTLTSGSQSYSDVCFKRYSDFVVLDAKLKKSFPIASPPLPTLPPKKVFGNLNPAFIEKRRCELEKYLCALQFHGLPSSPLRSCREVQSFLPEAYTREAAADLVRFDVVDIGTTFGKNHDMQLTIYPAAAMLSMLTEDAGAAAAAVLNGLEDSQPHGSSSRVVVNVLDIISLNEVEGQPLRVQMTYAEETPKTSAEKDKEKHDSGKRKKKEKERQKEQETEKDSDHAPVRRISQDDSVLALGASRKNSAEPSSLASSLSTQPSFPSGAHLPSSSSLLSNASGSSTASSLSTPSPLSASSSHPNAHPVLAHGNSSGSLPRHPVSLKTGSGGLSRKRILQFVSVSDRQRFLVCLKCLILNANHAALESSPLSSPISSFPPLPLYRSLAYQSTSAFIPEYRTLSIFTTTFNLAKQPHAEDLSAWLPPLGGSHHIIAIAVQECTVALNALSDAVARHIGAKFSLLARKSLWEIKLLIFIREDVRDNHAVAGVESASVATGILGIMGNKGGVAVALKLYHYSICFICTHLAANMERYGERNRQFEEIDSSLHLGLSELEMCLQFDVLIWLGDLNYRVELPHKKIIDQLRKKNLEPLLNKDQLKHAQFAQDAFAGFLEGQIEFGPSYKLQMPKKHSRQRSRSEKVPDMLLGISPDSRNSSSGRSPTVDDGGQLLLDLPTRDKKALSLVPEENEEENAMNTSGTAARQQNPITNDKADEKYDTSKAADFSSTSPSNNLSVPFKGKAKRHSDARYRRSRSVQSGSAMLGNGRDSLMSIRSEKDGNDAEKDGKELEDSISEGEEEDDTGGDREKAALSEDEDEDDDDHEDEEDFLRKKGISHDDGVDEDVAEQKQESAQNKSPLSQASDMKNEVPPSTTVTAAAAIESGDFASCSRSRGYATLTTSASPSCSVSHSGTASPDGPRTRENSNGANNAGEGGADGLLIKSDSNLSIGPAPSDGILRDGTTPNVVQLQQSLSANSAIAASDMRSTQHSAAAQSSSSPSSPTHAAAASSSSSSTAAPLVPGHMYSALASLVQQHSDSNSNSSNRSPRRRSATVPSQVGRPPQSYLHTRAYAKKRVPSWTDRILWRCIDQSSLILQSYYRCDGVNTSDHLPVCAHFQLRVPLFPSLTAFARPSQFRLSSVCLDLMINPNKLKNVPKDAAATIEKHLYLTFYGSVLAESSRGKRTGNATVQLKILHTTPTVAANMQNAPADTSESGSADGPSPMVVIAHWNDSDVPLLSGVIGVRNYLAQETIFYVVRAGDEIGGGNDLVLGAGMIRLNTLELPQTQAVSSNTIVPTTTTLPRISEYSKDGHSDENTTSLRSDSADSRSVSLSSAISASSTSSFVSSSSTASSSAASHVQSGRCQTSWHFLSQIERHSAPFGELSGNLLVDLSDNEYSGMQTDVDKRNTAKEPAINSAESKPSKGTSLLPPAATGFFTRKSK